MWKDVDTCWQQFPRVEMVRQLLSDKSRKQIDKKLILDIGLGRCDVIGGGAGGGGQRGSCRPPTCRQGWALGKRY